MKLLKRLFARYGRLVTVKNKDRRFGSSQDYQSVWLIDQCGDSVIAMFTENELINALTRATDNPEDVPTKPLI
jgi:hypothetical protein